MPAEKNWFRVHFSGKNNDMVNDGGENMWKSNGKSVHVQRERTTVSELMRNIWILPFMVSFS